MAGSKAKLSKKQRRKLREQLRGEIRSELWHQLNRAADQVMDRVKDHLWKMDQRIRELEAKQGDDLAAPDVPRLVPCNKRSGQLDSAD